MKPRLFFLTGFVLLAILQSTACAIQEPLNPDDLEIENARVPVQMSPGLTDRGTSSLEEAMAPAETDEQTETASQAGTAPIGQPPAKNTNRSGRSWSDVETMMTICILAFGVLTLFLQTFICFRLKIEWTPYSILQFYGLTLVIVGSLLLITAGYSDQQIAGVIGLLGTIAGYLLGKTPDKEVVVRSEAPTNNS